MIAKIGILAIDLSNGIFQVCAVGPERTDLYNRAFSRARLLTLLADQPACLLAMEACATSHHWGLVALSHGREVRRVATACVNPFAKRHKNDLAEAKAIAETALRPTMRFVAVKSAADLKRPCSIPDIGPVTNGAVAGFAPDLNTFDGGPNFTPWLDIVPGQRSTDGKAQLGAVSKMGQTDIRRLLIVGKMSVIRWVVCKGDSPNRWLAALVARQPKLVAAVALANKIARMIWALTTKQENSRMA